MSLLEQNTIRKGRADEIVPLLKFEAGDSKEYEMETIRDSTVYARESQSDHLPELYYLVSWKGYPEEENTWEPSSAVQHPRKLLSSFHRYHPDKPKATSPAVDTAPPMARPTIRSTVKPTEPASKRKRNRPAKNGANKRAKRNWNWGIL